MPIDQRHKLRRTLDLPRHVLLANTSAIHGTGGDNHNRHDHHHKSTNHDDSCNNVESSANFHKGCQHHNDGDDATCSATVVIIFHGTSYHHDIRCSYWHDHYQGGGK